MRPRTEAIIGIAALLAATTLAAVAGSRRAAKTPTIDRLTPSTFLTDPGGARGLFDASRRLAIEVQRFRARPADLPTIGSRRRDLLAVLDPTLPVSAADLRPMLAWRVHGALLLAGDGAATLMHCFGYDVKRKLFDSAATIGAAGRPVYVHRWLLPTGRNFAVDSSRELDVGRVRCDVPPMQATTLLESSLGPAIIQLDSDTGQRVLLIADPALVSNRALRETDAGPFILSLVNGEYDRIVFDEYHHGYTAAGSLGDATLAWSKRSPWGWAVWQLVGVGVLALLVASVRYGPAQPAISRVRRSSLEHLRALATALSAARGHDEAIAAIVRGLRRRLAPPALRTRGDWRAWLEQRRVRADSPAERDKLNRLTTLTQPGQPPASVLQAAQAVEDLWQNLQH